MKFSNGDRTPSGEPVAYIDDEGDLRIKTADGVVVLDHSTNRALCNTRCWNWNPHDPDNGQKFYPGDQIVIDLDPA